MSKNTKRYKYKDSQNNIHTIFKTLDEDGYDMYTPYNTGIDSDKTYGLCFESYDNAINYIEKIIHKK